MSSVSREDWVSEVLSFVGTPYKHQGRVPQVGMDCVAPLIVAARKFGIVADDFDVTAYPRDPNGSLQPLLDEHLERKSRESLLIGDVVLNGFRFQQPRHVAIIVGERYGQWQLVHAHSSAGRVQIERLQYGPYWRYVQGYGVPGVT